MRCLHCEQQKIMKCHPADSLAFDKLSARSFLYIRNRSGPNAEPWGAHALTPGKEKVCTLSTTLCFVFLKKLNNKFKMISHMLFCLSLKIIPLCHTLANALKLGIHLMIYGIFFIQMRTKLYNFYHLLLYFIWTYS